MHFRKINQFPDFLSVRAFLFGVHFAFWPITKAKIDWFFFTFILIIVIVLTLLTMYRNVVFPFKIMKKQLQINFSGKIIIFTQCASFFVWCSSRVSLSQRTDEKRRPLLENKYTFGISIDIFCLFICLFVCLSLMQKKGILLSTAFVQILFHSHTHVEYILGVHSFCVTISQVELDFPKS